MESEKKPGRGLFMKRGTLVYEAEKAPSTDVVDWIAEDRRGRLEDLLRRAGTSIKLAEYDFEYVCEIAPHRGGDGKPIPFMPQGRYRNTRDLPLNQYGGGPFCKFRIP